MGAIARALINTKASFWSLLDLLLGQKVAGTCLMLSLLGSWVSCYGSRSGGTPISQQLGVPTLSQTVIDRRDQEIMEISPTALHPRLQSWGMTCPGLNGL